MTNQTRIDELAIKIQEASDNYYNGQPTVSDKVWDAWRDELARLDPNHSVLKQIGAPVKGAWPKVKHLTPMASLNKVNTPDELRHWANTKAKVTTVLSTEKLDGISIDLVYKDGRLEEGNSRGNGETGQKIGPNVRKMHWAVAKIKDKFSGHIRGEIVLLKSNWKKYFPDMSTARNAACGIATRLDGEGVEHLTIMCYTVEGKDFATEEEHFKWIEAQGFNIPNWEITTVEGAIKQWDKYQKSIRESLDYDIDGMVIRVNDRVKQLALGDEGRGPKGAIAFKFEDEMAESVLRNVPWQVGNTGTVTPVAEFDEVILGGAKVTRASLYNMDYIQSLGLDIGATILVKRANEVIPRVEEVVKGTGKILSPPTKCPACGTKLVNNGAYLRCLNKNGCGPQVLGRISKWVKELGIMEWGDKNIQKMIDAGLVKDVADIYKLKAKDISALDRMGETSAKNLVAELDKFRTIPLENFVGGLNIDGVATSTTKQIIKQGYDTLDAMKKMSIKELENIPGFGSIRAHNFHQGLKDNANRIKDILDAGVNIKARTKGKLTGKYFCFTGASELPRNKLHQLVEAAGGEIKKTVGKDMVEHGYLVMADANSTSSKAQAARKIGIKLISEAEFMKML